MFREQNLHRSRYPELCVNIREHHMKDGRVRVTGTAIRAADASEYPDIAPYQTKPVSHKRVNSAITEAIGVIESHYYETYGEGKLTEEALDKALKAVEEAVRNGLRLKPSWNAASTNTNVIQFFSRNTLPLLKPIFTSDRLFLDEDRVQLQENMTKICARHGSESALAARENANKRLTEAEIVLAHMRDYDARVPEIRVTTSDFSVRAYRKEQIKMLPIAVLRRFYLKLRALVKEMPKKVFFAVLVIFNPRPAEAAGTKPSDIVWHDTFCSVRICHQEKEGKIIDRMKNNYSKRQIVIPWWGRDLLELCCELIGEDYPADDRAMNIAVECAAWVKQLLIECGATEAELRELGKDISDEDMDDESVYDAKRAEETMRDRETKLGCYVLRRCAATIMRVFMGLTLYETDRLLGHIPHGSGKNTATKLSHPDLNAPETKRRIAEKMERYVYDPAFSRNPKFTPITTAGRDSIPLSVAYPKIRIENNEETDLWAELDLWAEEAEDSLSLTLPSSDSGKLAFSSVPISYEGVDRTVFVEMPEIETDTQTGKAGQKNE